MKPCVKPARPKVFRPDHNRVLYPSIERCPSAFGDFKPDRLLRLALQNRRAFLDLARRHDIDNLHPYQIAATQLAVDGQVAMVLGKFKPNPDRPDMFWLERSLLSHDAALVPGGGKGGNDRQV